MTVAVGIIILFVILGFLEKIGLLDTSTARRPADTPFTVNKNLPPHGKATPLPPAKGLPTATPVTGGERPPLNRQSSVPSEKVALPMAAPIARRVQSPLPVDTDPEVRAAMMRLSAELLSERHINFLAYKTARMRMGEKYPIEGTDVAFCSVLDAQERDLIQRGLATEPQLVSGLHYSRPDFEAIPSSDSAALSAVITAEVGKLKRCREEFISQINKGQGSKLYQTFIEAFREIGGPGTASSLKEKPRPSADWIHLNTEGPGPSVGTTASNSLEMLAAFVAAGRTRERDWCKIAHAEYVRSVLPDTAKAQSVRPNQDTPPKVSEALFDERQSRIQYSANRRRIRHLLHFTNVENLESILNCGLCSVQLLREREMDFRNNDRLRLDRYPQATSLSIAHPNDKMFAKYRWGSTIDDWVVLVVDFEILWSTDAAFCRHNAADSRIRQQSLEVLRGFDSFESMFLPLPAPHERDSNPLLDCDPTDVQAEVLVFEVIPPKRIQSVIFGSARTMSEFERRLHGRPARIHSEGKGFFGPRSSARRSGWTYNG